MNQTVRFKIVLPFMFTSQVSGDGLNSVQVGLPQSGVSYVMYGVRTPALPGKVFSRDLIGISPAVSYDFSGRSVSNAGDVNVDGYDDLIIGVPYAARCYVMFGTKLGFVNMTEGFTIFGSDGDLTGWSVSGAGDVNNDTFADVIICVPAGGSSLTGAAYVIYGGESGRSVDLSDLSVTQGFAIFGVTGQDYFGVSVSGAGLSFCSNILLIHY
jgi:hypothetical protein